MSPNTYKDDHCHKDKRQYKQGCWKGVLAHHWCKCYWHNHWRTVWQCLREVKTELYNSAIQCLDTYAKEMKLVCQGDIRFPVSTVAPFVIKGSQSMCLPTDELVKKIYLVQPNKIPVCHWKRREVCKGDSRAECGGHCTQWNKPGTDDRHCITWLPAESSWTQPEKQRAE